MSCINTDCISSKKCDALAQTIKMLCEFKPDSPKTGQFYIEGKDQNCTYKIATQFDCPSSGTPISGTCHENWCHISYVNNEGGTYDLFLKAE